MDIRKQDPRYIATLVLVSLAILLAGAMVRPGRQQSEAQTASNPIDIRQLDRITQRRSIEDIASYFAYVASLVEGSVVLLESSMQSGVLWQAGEILTAKSPGSIGQAEKILIGGQEVDQLSMSTAPHLPYVLLQVPPDAGVGYRAPSGLYRRGSWVLAAWRSKNGQLHYLQGNLFGTLERVCGSITLTEMVTNLDLGGTRPGAGIFAVDGNLLAVVMGCDGDLIAVEVDALAAQIRMDPSLEERVMRQYGLRAITVFEAELEFFGRQQGVLVEEVWRGHRAHEAGLRPGDVIDQVNDVQVQSVNDLEPLLQEDMGEGNELLIWRNRRRLRIQLETETAAADNTSLQRFSEKTEEGLAIEDVDPGSLAEHAGARKGDRLLYVNQVSPRSFAAVNTLISRAGNGLVHLVLEREGRIWGVLVLVNE